MVVRRRRPAGQLLVAAVDRGRSGDEPRTPRNVCLSRQELFPHLQLGRGRLCAGIRQRPRDRRHPVLRRQFYCAVRSIRRRLWPGDALGDGAGHDLRTRIRPYVSTSRLPSHDGLHDLTCPGEKRYSFGGRRRRIERDRTGDERQFQMAPSGKGVPQATHTPTEQG